MIVKYAETEYYQILKPDRVVEISPRKDLEKHFDFSKRWVRQIADNFQNVCYAAGKWSVKEVIGHLADCHILLMYRMLNIAKQDFINIPGADENLWGNKSERENLSFEIVKKLYLSSADSFLNHALLIPEPQYSCKGIANGFEISVYEFFYYAIAHERHHFRMLREKYGVV